MIVFSQDKKAIFSGKIFTVEKTLGGKDKKYAIVGQTKGGMGRTLAYYESEKLACDALEQLFAAMYNGEKAFDLSD